MGRITVDQSHQVMAALAVNTNWEEIDFDALGLQDTIVRNPKGAGAAFTAWLKSVAKSEARQEMKLKPLLSVVETFKLGPDVISTLAPSKRATFAEWAAAVLGVPTDTPIQMLEKLLKECGCTLTSAQVEEMKQATDRGEKTGMRTDGWGNFYFVENEDGSVSVGNVHRDGHVWLADVDSLDCDGRWFSGYRLLVRNLDASKL